ncbi:ABC transporter ATP-binding protein [Marinicauda salina]|uniref:ABC transporter ATP-binding protein n=1 Tax=Marinicauda salina TaxID=2135793 RepID=UPI0022B87A23|nr:ABC transporter ATP-binding protein [Marinicauda salina]
MLALGLSALTAAAASAYPALVEHVSNLIDARDRSVIYLAPALILALTGFRALTLYLQTLTTNRLALAIMRDLQIAMYARLIAADFARLQGEAVGALISRFTNDITMLRESLIRSANNLLRDSLTIVGVLGVMVYLDWVLTLVVVVLMPLAGQPVLRIGKAIRKRSTDVQSQMGDVTSFLEESFAGARTIKSFSLESYAQERSETRFRERFRLMLSMVAQRARIEPVMEVAGGLAIAVVFAVAGWRAANGATDLADLVAFIFALLVLSPSARALGSLFGVIQEGLAVLQRVFAVLDEEPALLEAADAAPLKIDGGAIEFDDVEFGYAGDQSALDHVSLTVPAGETVALVGPSGSGKTTLLNLILRLYDPRSGRVQIDGQDIRGATFASLRGAISLVSQESTLFDDTVRANIALGKLDASDAEIEAAAKAADADDFISQLPQGYDTPVGPRGSNLSGGQRQRIAIARAVLKDAPILLLDEATSALDARSEARVQDALDRLRKGRTTLVIAHRLSTVRAADRICVLENGRVVETGSHDALVEKGGLYADLAKLQFRDGE